MSENCERRLLGAWIPDESPSIMALVFRHVNRGGTTFRARITRFGETIGDLEASDLRELARQLTARCGPARRSMVKLGVATPL